ncbi:unnamed protein product [Fraxinus pennsylvanica]|uniref:HMA domain-containing protein n=1 Tax=Fraxinus pennsylvanica TaxID=56036 RepID=A0AAD1YZ97_9LAMI|nr:unnamed protein product [Fraxinus pennsylvanica]
MGEKVTVMVLKVDLQCPSCYKKIKKILCNIPQIRGQIYDDKQNTVTINVVCCSPEKIRDKLCCKGGKVIQSIEIKGPKKCKEQKPEEEKPKEEKPKEEKPDNPPPPPTPPMKERILVPLYPSARTCCGPCSEGYGGGPCYHGYPYPLSCNYSCYGYWCREAKYQEVTPLCGADLSTTSAFTALQQCFEIASFCCSTNVCVCVSISTCGLHVCFLRGEVGVSKSVVFLNSTSMQNGKLRSISDETERKWRKGTRGHDNGRQEKAGHFWLCKALFSVHEKVELPQLTHYVAAL